MQRAYRNDNQHVFRSFRWYVSETGSIEALYVYDAYGNTIDQSGEKANAHSFGFSTKYHDREVGLIGYQKRFYRPDYGRWLNRDPIEEEGGDHGVRPQPDRYIARGFPRQALALLAGTLPCAPTECEARMRRPRRRRPRRNRA